MISFKTAELLLKRPNVHIDATIISKQQIRVILSLLECIINNNIPGDVVEFGCFVGESSKYLRMLLDHKLSDKRLYVYDSFEGLPALSDYEKNTNWKPGTLKTSEDVLIQNFEQNGLKAPEITKGWFKDIPNDKIPKSISFAFLDGDFYESIYDSLEKIFNKLSPGSMVVFHDYERPDLPGVKAAIENFISKNKLENNAYILFKIFHELGVFIKQ
jgi:O-methyltransferase